jgi:hypothetical protein
MWSRIVEVKLYVKLCITNQKRVMMGHFMNRREGVEEPVDRWLATTKRKETEIKMFLYKQTHPLIQHVSTVCPGTGHTDVIASRPLLSFAFSRAAFEAAYRVTGLSRKNKYCICTLSIIVESNDTPLTHPSYTSSVTAFILAFIFLI